MQSASLPSGNDPARFDDSVARWNWGAFLIPVLWAPAHRLWLWAVLWIALSWTIIGAFVLAIYLGAKGSELAWRARPFRDADHFRQVQSRWAGWGIAITIVVLIFMLAAFGMERESGQRVSTSIAARTVSEPGEAHPLPAVPTWQKVASWTGRGVKQTETFTVGDEWKVMWDTHPGSLGEGNFQVYLYRQGSEFPDVIANVIGGDEDESFQHRGGVYYLSVNAIQPWSLSVWEKR